MDKVYRVYVKKIPLYATESGSLLQDIKSQLALDDLTDLEIINRYDLQGIDEDTLKKALPTVLSEPMVDEVFLEDYPIDDQTFAIEYLPGQYDQRADATSQCLMILCGKDEIKVKYAKLISLKGDLSKEDIQKIQAYLINPVDQRLADLAKKESLEDEVVPIADVPTINSFIHMDEAQLTSLLKEMGLAMSLADLKVTQEYFKNDIQRDPTETEIRVLDTYWSDHCRHTTFGTIIDDIALPEGIMHDVYAEDLKAYELSRQKVYADKKAKPVSLMDLATIAMKELRKDGLLDDMEVSEEINACSVKIKVHTAEGFEDWLLMFKNETHNHPTEIEPFGGAATCLGGAIRDPLSGRSYVYHAMRISGAKDPRTSLKDTLKGKLSQRKLCQEAAHGFSSYGNQIGLTTGYVHELYDDGYQAKRLELGAVVAAAPADQVKRLKPQAGDIVLLVGGRTGRDGIGGATGSSKTHSEKTTSTAGAEVQKGNPIEERKLQRLFRNPEVAKKIIRCNDFGAGGVAVAVGELAESLDIVLDNVLKKYEGLNGTELAISESQERMAIVIKAEDYEFILKACHDENLEAVKVATVTDDGHLRMTYRNQEVVDIKRSFLDQNGAERHQTISLNDIDLNAQPYHGQSGDFKALSKQILSDLAVCSQKGLVERFDSTIGSDTVLMPYGGKTYGSETEGMAALIPTLGKDNSTCSLMAYGYDPLIAKWSPYHGAMDAVVESLTKIVAMGGDYHKAYFSLQEFFPKLYDDPKRWGAPLSALLGAYHAQKALKLAAIGGKDSMSGSFENHDVPPTLVSFAITAQDVSKVITPEIKKTGHSLYLLKAEYDERHIIDFDKLTATYDTFMKLNDEGKIHAAYTVKTHGILEALYKMAFGNRIGIKLEDLSLEELTKRQYGSLIIESDHDLQCDSELIKLGETVSEPYIQYQDNQVSLEDAYNWYCDPLENVYPTMTPTPKMAMEEFTYDQRTTLHAKKHYEVVKVVIPIFPGTNCEYDSQRAFEKAGAKVKTVLIRNKTAQDVKASINELTAAINEAQIIMLPGGFSAGDEPEGSGKFIATFLRNPQISKAIDAFLNEREGLMLGICNGFQALIKLGLLPKGKIVDLSKEDATLTFNTINRHVARMVKTKITSVKSPWLANVNVNDTHIIPISHGEGRFVADDEVLKELKANGQIITRYVDDEGHATMDSLYNPNGSMWAIEGIVSKDGRILGKMGHSERIGDNLYKNIYGEMDQKIFEAGVAYFK